MSSCSNGKISSDALGIVNDRSFHLIASLFLGLINNLNVEECLAKGTELSSVIIQKIGARI